VNVDEICTKTIIPQGVSSFERIEAKLYPNPASNFMTLESIYKGTVLIYDMMGSVVKTQAIELGVNSISLESLNEGNYIILFQTSHGVYSQRISKQ
jgi:hypothetical protein